MALTQASASPALVKALALIGATLVVGPPAMHFVMDQTPAESESLWLALAVIVPLILTFVAWMVRDSGNLRQLAGEFKSTKEKVDKIDDSQERIFRELGGTETYRDATAQRLDRMDADIKQQDRYRHDLRDELTPKLVDSQMAAMERIDKLEARLLDVERRRGGR